MKTIFIPYSVVPQWIRSGLNVPLKENIDTLYWLGLVNQFLGNKANAKEIVDVELSGANYDTDGNFLGYNTNPVGFFETVEGYLITYLESDMIANKDDLEDIWFNNSLKE